MNNVIAKKNFTVHSILSFMIYLISNKFYLSNSREIDHFRIKNEPKYYDAEYIYQFREKVLLKNDLYQHNSYISAFHHIKKTFFHDITITRSN